MLVTPSLILRLEDSDAAWLAQSVSAAGGEVLRFGNGTAANLGPGNVLTQVVGVVESVDWKELWSLYAGIEQPFEFKLSPIATPEICRHVAERAVGVHEFESILIRDTSRGQPQRSDIVIGEVTREGLSEVVQRSVGWFYPNERPSDFVRTITASLSIPISRTSAVLVEEEIVAVASLTVSEGIGWLHGGAVAPSFRGRGFHQALIAHRINVARELGAGLVAQGASPGTISQQNAQRNGFEIAYTRPALLVRPPSRR